MSRLHRSCGTSTEDHEPLAALTAHHSGVPTTAALARSRGNGHAGRNRRRGSPFAALSDACKPPRVWLAPATGRGGEIIARSGAFAWPLPLDRAAADPRQVQQDRCFPSMPMSSLPPVPLRAADHNAVEQPQLTATRFPIATKEENRGVVDRHTGAAMRLAVTSPTLSTPKGERTGRQRRVTWAGTVDTKEVARTSSCDIFSPDLYSMEIAKELAILAEEPELTRAANAVMMVRRQAASIVRSLSARHGWNGSLDGLEEACRLWTRRESAYLRETDEIVRNIVSPRREGGGEAAGNHGDARTVWRLKAMYRDARRRMEDAESD